MITDTTSTMARLIAKDSIMVSAGWSKFLDKSMKAHSLMVKKVDTEEKLSSIIRTPAYSMMVVNSMTKVSSTTKWTKINGSIKQSLELLLK